MDKFNLLEMDDWFSEILSKRKLALFSEGRIVKGISCVTDEITIRRNCTIIYFLLTVSIRKKKLFIFLT